MLEYKVWDFPMVTLTTVCKLGAVPSSKTIMVRPTCPVIEYSNTFGVDLFLQVKLEWRLVISASSLRPDKVASSLVLCILATPKTTSFECSGAVAENICRLKIFSRLVRRNGGHLESLNHRYFPCSRLLRTEWFSTVLFWKFWILSVMHAFHQVLKYTIVFIVLSCSCNKFETWHTHLIPSILHH